MHWNRDRNGSLNIMRCGMAARNDRDRPPCMDRIKIGETKQSAEAEAIRQAESEATQETDSEAIQQAGNVLLLLGLGLMLWWLCVPLITERDHSIQRMGHAAIVILHTANREKFLLQRKTAGYPYYKMVDTVCMLGGNYEVGDLSARETLHRELMEELGLDVVDAIKPFSRYMITASMNMMHPKPHPYSFVCCVFSSEITEAKMLELTTKEGGLEVLGIDQLRQRERFAWGYDLILSDFVGGEEFRNDYEKCGAKRLSSLIKIGKWSDEWEEWT
ncbi:hypothetical protein BASA81_006681 [Batrachochytrium salamandrivorans]|nr:hypothetical protein BASA81_006681 [Batrachochytrium salamandrivorans]